MLTDPQTITIDSVPHTLPRVGTGDGTSTYTEADRSHSIEISHAYGKRTRSVVRLNHRKVADDPLLEGVDKKYSMSTYLVIDTPDVGYSQQEVTDLVVGFLTYINSVTLAVTGGES